MLARGTPETPLDVRRLSDFSAEPKKSHGAGSAHRIQHRERLLPTYSVEKLDASFPRARTDIAIPVPILPANRRQRAPSGLM